MIIIIIQKMDLKDTYNRIAADWDNDHKDDSWWIKHSTKLISLLPKGATILDAGCGAGHKSKYLTNQGFKVTGIDFSEKLLEIARKNSPDTNFILMDLYDLDEFDEKFDCVFAQASLLHIPKARIMEVLQKLKDKIKPNGLLYVGVKSARPGQIEEEIMKENDYGYEYERFFSYYTLPEMKSYFEKLGMEIILEEVTSSGKTNWVQITGRVL